MTNMSKQVVDEKFNPPRSVSLSPAALEYLKAYVGAARAQPGNWVLTFEWDESILYKDGPDATPVELGPCLSLGGYRRDQIPDGYVHSIEGVEFAVAIPQRVLEASAHRLIDRDDSRHFKLVLR